MLRAKPWSAAIFTLCCAVALTCAGCSNQTLSPRIVDPAVGVAAGATLGAIIGAAAGGPVIGTLVGAGVGGVGGFLLGNQIAQEQSRQSQQNYQGGQSSVPSGGGSN